MNNRGWNRNSRGGFRGVPNRGGFGRGGNRGWRGNHGSRGHDTQNHKYQQWPNRQAKDLPGPRLLEENIGVTEYMTDHKGFNGIIKLRYADFQVSEVNDNGEVAKLTDLTPPQLHAEEQIDDEELLNKYNLELLPMETWDQINALAIGPQTCTDVVEIEVMEMTKEQRTKIHDAIKKAFGENIVGSTVNIGDKKLMRFGRYRKGIYIDKRVKWTWPAQYVRFIVYKENIDTMEAATKIAERLRLVIKPAMLGYAGTKDRRAKTTQWFSLRKVDPRVIAASCKNMRDLSVGNYSFHTKQVKLGMLKGNVFRIALRNVEESDEIVESACQNLRDRGFINYYGLQRFGSRVEMPTWDIGKKLLQGNYKEVVDGILAERAGPLQEVLREFREQGAAAALRLLPRSARSAHSAHSSHSAHSTRGHNSEMHLLRALAKNPTDFLCAIQKIPRNVRLLYVHAFQSLVYNCAVTERLRRLGFRPAPGDLVIHPDDKCENELDVGDDANNFESQQEDDDEENQDGDEENDNDEIEDNADNNDAHDDTVAGNDTEKIVSNSDKQSDGAKEDYDTGKPKVEVKVLTQEDVDRSRYTIFDVVMPLPGSNVEYPPNMKEFYEEMLKKDGLTLKMKHRVKSYSMSGTYRRLCVRPAEMSWRCVRYTDPHADLLLSDMDELEGNNNLGIIPDGIFKAVLLTMTLPASCYATMALRELMKVDTSSMTQALQNDYYKLVESSHKKRPADDDEDDSAKKAKID